jgi:hypothetical protein
MEFKMTKHQIKHYSQANTGCGKLTSFFEYEMPFEKGS